MRTITIMAIGFTLMFVLFTYAGRAVEAFTESIDGSNGVAGSTYNANP